MSKGLWAFCALFFGMVGLAGAQEGGTSFEERIDNVVKPFSDWIVEKVFYSVPFLNGQSVPLVALILAGTGIFLTLFFKFINLRAVGAALRTVRGKYTRDDAPGEITHFQALTSALSATVGLGNIAGVAVAMGLGGPGAAFWMVIMGLLGMTTKFAECTLGVKYRRIDEKTGKVQGGAMYYLTDGFKDVGGPVLAKVGLVLAVFFAIFTVGGAMGAGNMYQVNQAYSQFSATFGVLNEDGDSVIFGVILAVLVGMVIIGGIRSIGKVTAVLIPFMTIIYVLAGIIILGLNAGQIPEAVSQIVSGAFSPMAVVGGGVGALIQGIRRAVFSNEAGLGSAGIAHSAVKTDKPASEGLVALLEPMVDTVVVCTMTALVIVVTGQWKVDAYVADGREAEIRVVEMGAISEAKEEAGGDKFDVEKSVFDGAPVLATLGEGVKFRNIKTDSDWMKVYPEPALVAKLKEQVPNLVLRTGMTDSGDAGIAEQFGIEENGEVRSVELWVDLANSGDAGNVVSQMDITKTSAAFNSKIAHFDRVLAVAVVLFAFSTMLSWSYYGEQAILFLCGGKYNARIVYSYKLVFCLVIVVGAGMKLNPVINISDSLLFLMLVPNLIGVYVLLPVIRRELKRFQEHMAHVDAGGEK